MEMMMMEMMMMEMMMMMIMERRRRRRRRTRLGMWSVWPRSRKNRRGRVVLSRYAGMGLVGILISSVGMMKIVGSVAFYMIRQRGFNLLFWANNPPVMLQWTDRYVFFMSSPVILYDIIFRPLVFSLLDVLTGSTHTWSVVCALVEAKTSLRGGGRQRGSEEEEEEEGESKEDAVGRGGETSLCTHVN
eukprot:768506-Hanusia_phi.AAC.2